MTLPGATFLDPRVLARIGNLELMAKTVVEGFINGLHHSPYLGLSVDFAEHRAYMPGDDIRRIDWRLWARSDRYYIKEFEADTNANFRILFDVSRSMSYAGRGLPKLDYGRYLAACLAYFSHKQRDRVGIVTFDSEVIDHVPPSAKHLDIVLHTLDRMKPGGPGNLERPLRKIGETVQRRSLLVLISDLYEPPETVLNALTNLKGKGNDLIVFHLLDPMEREFPFEQPASFEDLESGDRVPVVPEQLRDQYRALVTHHVAELGRILGEHQIDYSLFDTSQPLDYALFEYLSRRERLSRVR